MTKSMGVRMVIGAVIAWGLGPVAAGAQAKPEGWSASLNLSGVVTTGNTETTNFGAQAAINRNWLRTLFFVTGGGLRQDAVEVRKFAIGEDPNTAPVFEEKERVPQAENYFAEIGFERRVTERFLFHFGGGYERNLFSGVERKLSGRGGVGFVRTSTDQEFKVVFLATYTDQQEQVPDPNTKERFAGARVTVDYALKFGRTKQNAFTTRLAVDGNLEVTEDVRTAWDNALNVGMTDWLSFQVATKLAYRNLPALQEIDVISPRTGQPLPTKKTIPLEKLDNQFQVSLVINWSPRRQQASRPSP